MGFGGALAKRDKDGAPWVPPWWNNFIVVPLLTISSFYLSQVDGWRGVASPRAEKIPWSEVTSDGIVGYVGGFLAFYFIFVLPIFVIRKHQWKRRHAGKADEEKRADP